MPSPRPQESAVKYVACGCVLVSTILMSVATFSHQSNPQYLFTTTSTTPTLSAIHAVRDARQLIPHATSMRQASWAPLNKAHESAQVVPRVQEDLPVDVLTLSMQQQDKAFWMWTTACSLMLNVAAFVFFRTKRSIPTGESYRATHIAMAAATGETEGPESAPESSPETEVVEDVEQPEEEPEVELTPEQLLQKELDETKAQLAEAEKKVLYAMAEVETMRRRAKQQVEDAKNFGVEKFAKNILEVLDNMGRGLAWVPKDVTEAEAGESNPNPDLRSLYGGMRSTEKIFLNILEREGITRFEPVGEQYNAETCRAIMQVADPNNEPGTVVQVAVAGYMLNGRVLRAADVIVVQED